MEGENPPAEPAPPSSPGASLSELRADEKLKIGNLLRELARAQREGNQASSERREYAARLQKLRAQNDSIIQDTASLRTKFRQSLELLKLYQHRLSEGGAPPPAGTVPDGLRRNFPHAAAAYDDHRKPPPIPVVEEEDEVAEEEEPAAATEAPAAADADADRGKMMGAATTWMEATGTQRFAPTATRAAATTTTS